MDNGTSDEDPLLLTLPGMPSNGPPSGNPRVLTASPSVGAQAQETGTNVNFTGFVGTKIAQSPKRSIFSSFSENDCRGYSEGQPSVSPE